MKENQECKRALSPLQRSQSFWTPPSVPQLTHVRVLSCGWLQTVDTTIRDKSEERMAPGSADDDTSV